MPCNPCPIPAKNLTFTWTSDDPEPCINETSGSVTLVYFPGEEPKWEGTHEITFNEDSDPDLCLECETGEAGFFGTWTFRFRCVFGDLVLNILDAGGRTFGGFGTLNITEFTCDPFHITALVNLSPCLGSVTGHVDE